MRSIFIVVLLVVAIFQVLSVPARAQTATGAMPSETTAEKKEIQRGMAVVLGNTSDAAFPGVAKADIGRAKACAVQALLADIPDEVAEELVVQLRGSSVTNAKLVTHWLMPGSADVARRNQIDARMAEICPELLQTQRVP